MADLVSEVAQQRETDGELSGSLRFLNKYFDDNGDFDNEAYLDDRVELQKDAQANDLVQELKALPRELEGENSSEALANLITKMTEVSIEAVNIPPTAYVVQASQFIDALENTDLSGLSDGEKQKLEIALDLYVQTVTVNMADGYNASSLADNQYQALAETFQTRIENLMSDLD